MIINRSPAPRLAVDGAAHLLLDLGGAADAGVVPAVVPAAVERSLVRGREARARHLQLRLADLQGRIQRVDQKIAS